MYSQIFTYPKTNDQNLKNMLEQHHIFLQIFKAGGKHGTLKAN